jgi:hypothetical protein
LPALLPSSSKPSQPQLSTPDDLDAVSHAFLWLGFGAAMMAVCLASFWLLGDGQQ